MAVKIKDVAERAGVAKSTVSNALTGNKYVSEELKQKILKICEEMNYHPSFYASKMAGDQSNIIALFLEESESGQYHSFYTELIESCLKHISASGYNLFISYNADGRERQGLLQKGKTLLDGAIIISPASHDDERIALLEDELIPCVSIGKPADSQMVSYVDVDNARLVRNAVHLLALSGYTKIYLLNSSEKLNISCDRTASFLKALTDKKLEGDGSSICYCTESSEHNAEYNPWFIKANRPELVEQYNIPLDEYPRRCIKQIEGWEKEKNDILNDGKVTHERSKEYASYIMEAVVTGIPYKIGGNVINNGLISNLPSDACVEVPCLIDNMGVHPCQIGRLPVQLAAMNMTNINTQLMTIEAAVTKKRENIYQAAMLDPRTAAQLSTDEIVSLCDELIEAHGDYMKEYR